jgi:hypothetical protein
MLHKLGGMLQVPAEQGSEEPAETTQLGLKQASTFAACCRLQTLFSMARGTGDPLLQAEAFGVESEALSGPAGGLSGTAGLSMDMHGVGLTVPEDRSGDLDAMLSNLDWMEAIAGSP